VSGAHAEANAGAPHVVVVGAGVAGTAAALAAARAGARVTAVDGGTGASALATGALDLVDRPASPRAARDALPGAARGLLDALGGYVLPEGGALLLTTAGVVRPARGHDAALLDVAPLAGRRIGVVRCHRPGWDADALAHAWGDAYAPLDATVLRHADERVVPDADFAARHDDDARLAWLAERLREAIAPGARGWCGLVLPPSLGVERPRAAALSSRVGLPCGEPVAAPGGPSGLRFERGRDRALSAAGVEHVRARVASVQPAGDRWRVSADDGRAFDARAVVVASGGLVGRGLEYAPAETMHASALPPLSRPPVRLALDAPLAVGAHGRRLDVPGTLFGPAPESLAWPFARDPLLDRAGVLAGEDGAARGARGVFVAGDVVADAARTWLDALAAGARAGAAAAQHALTARSAPSSPRAAPASRP